MIPHSENRLTCKDKNAIYKGFKNVYEGEMQKCVKNNVVESFVFSLQCSLAHLKTQSNYFVFVFLCSEVFNTFLCSLATHW